MDILLRDGMITKSFRVIIWMKFLEVGKVYEATIYADAHDADYKENPQAYEISTREVTCKDVLQMTMASGGGFAISFEEKR